MSSSLCALLLASAMLSGSGIRSNGPKEARRQPTLEFINFGLELGLDLRELGVVPQVTPSIGDWEVDGNYFYPAELWVVPGTGDWGE